MADMTPSSLKTNDPRRIGTTRASPEVMIGFLSVSEGKIERNCKNICLFSVVVTELLANLKVPGSCPSKVQSLNFIPNHYIFRVCRIGLKAMS